VVHALIVRQESKKLYPPSNNNMCRYLKIFLLLMVSSSTLSAGSACWKSNGKQAAQGTATFGSTEQGNMLTKLVQANPECPFVAITWSIDFTERGGCGTQHSLLLWDRDAKSIIPLHVHKQLGIKWETWSSVTRESIKAEDMSHGFDFSDYTTGHGKAHFTPAAVKFIKSQQPDTGITLGI
jgi:hypothetical protein